MPNLFKEQMEYIKDNPENLWFKRKLYGWGWTPVRWQGWVAILMFIIFLWWNTVVVFGDEIPTNIQIISFIIRIFLATFALIFVCYKKGEKPRWQWGPSEKNK